MYSDFHLHTLHSADSTESPENVITRCISLGMRECCITDHNDFNWPVQGESFDLDVGQYFANLIPIKEKFSDLIDVKIGIECGMTPNDSNLNKTLISNNNFDFVIGSCHIVDGMDPYYPEFYENKTNFEALSLYFNEIRNCLEQFSDFDVLGHMDYVIRYSPSDNRSYNISDYGDVIDFILKKLIYLGKGIEINTSGLKSGLDFANPGPSVLKRYRELGGEIITIGSDAHNADFVGYEFDRAGDFLREAGFKYYCIFSNRKPEFKLL